MKVCPISKCIYGYIGGKSKIKQYDWKPNMIYHYATGKFCIENVYLYFII